MTELVKENNKLNNYLDELNELKNRYSNFYQHLPIGYIILNKRGKIKEVNKTGAAMLGFIPKILLMKILFNFIKDDFKLKFNEASLKSFDTNEIQYCKIEFIGKNQYTQIFKSNHY